MFITILATLVEKKKKKNENAEIKRNKPFKSCVYKIKQVKCDIIYSRSSKMLFQDWLNLYMNKT